MGNGQEWRKEGMVVMSWNDLIHDRDRKGTGRKKKVASRKKTTSGTWSLNSDTRKRIQNTADIPVPVSSSSVPLFPRGGTVAGLLRVGGRMDDAKR